MINYEKIGQPKNLEDAIIKLERMLKQDFKNTLIGKTDQDAVNLNSSELGSVLRKEWELFSNGKLCRYFNKKKVYAPETMTYFVIVGLVRYLNAETS